MRAAEHLRRAIKLADDLEAHQDDGIQLNPALALLHAVIALALYQRATALEVGDPGTDNSYDISSAIEDVDNSDVDLTGPE